MYYKRFSQARKKGQESEDNFKLIAKKNGFRVKKSTLKQNKYDHIDFFISRDGEKYSVDVKTVGKMGYTAEIANNFGYEGSLYGSADLIGYVDKHMILLVPRETLRNLVESRIKSGETKNSSDFYTLPNPYYKLYQRKEWNWKDIFTVLPRADVSTICLFQWSIR